jgi:hypothetical protein
MSVSKYAKQAGLDVVKKVSDGINSMKLKMIEDLTINKRRPLS